MPVLPRELPTADQGDWALGVEEGAVLVGGVCPAVQVDGTTCGSAAIGLAMASDGTAGAESRFPAARTQRTPSPAPREKPADPLDPVATQLAPEVAQVTPEPHPAEAVGEAQAQGDSIVENQDSDDLFSVSEEERAATARRFGELQYQIKARTNKRRWLFGWPTQWGTAPWGAARVMTFAGHKYTHRMVVDTSLPQATRVLTHAADAAERGFPVLLYTGGDTSRGWGTAVPRHVVVLHCPPLPPTVPEPILDESERTGIEHIDARLEEFSAKLKATVDRAKGIEERKPLFIYDPATGRNTLVTLDELINKGVDPSALGGWNHLTWAVVPTPARVKDASTIQENS